MAAVLDVRVEQQRSQMVPVPTGKASSLPLRSFTRPVEFRPEESAGPRGAWVLSWSDVRGRLLPDGFGSSLREALGLLVEIAGDVVQVHVAHHRRRRGGLDITGLWNITLGSDGSLLRCRWSARRGRALSYVRRLRLPLRLIRGLARRVLMLQAQAGRARPVRMN
jgi:hypothetical protein